MGAHGAALVPPGGRLLTHCNAGALATAGYGTALGVVRAAHEQKKLALVWVDETRPVMQGSRLTAWEMAKEGIPHRLISDVAAGAAMRQGLVDLVVTGADRIARNGDTANKIGTYACRRARAASRHPVLRGGAVVHHRRRDRRAARPSPSRSATPRRCAAWRAGRPRRRRRRSGTPPST